MNRDPGIQQWPSAALQCFTSGPHAGRCSGKTPLIKMQCGLIESGTFVQHRQHGKTHAGLVSRISQRPRQPQWVCIGCALGIMLQVVKLADLGIATA